MIADGPIATDPKIAATVRIVARGGEEDMMLDLLSRMSALAAQDDGTEIWAVHRGPRESSVFFLYELFRDRESFAAHRANEALNQLGRELEELAVELIVTPGRLVGGVHPLL